MDTNDDLVPTRQSLLSRLRDWGDSASWQDFFNTYWKLIYRTARKAGLNDAEAQDVVQETLLSVCKHIGTFRYDGQKGRFKSWLFKTTSWRIGDRLRQRQREEMKPLAADAYIGEALAKIDAAESSLAQSWEAEWESTLVEAAMARLKSRVPPKQLQVFDLAMIKHWPTERIAKTLSVSSGYVYLIKYRIGAQLKREVRKLRDDPYDAWSGVVAPSSSIGVF